MNIYIGESMCTNYQSPATACLAFYEKLKNYLTITLAKLKLSRPVRLGTGWIPRCEYRREGASFVLSFVLLLSVLSKLKRTLEEHKVKQARLRSETYRQSLFYLHFPSLIF